VVNLCNHPFFRFKGRLQHHDHVVDVAARFRVYCERLRGLDADASGYPIRSARAQGCISTGLDRSNARANLVSSDVCGRPLARGRGSSVKSAQQFDLLHQISVFFAIYQLY
jgi:hypothetical protein